MNEEQLSTYKALHRLFSFSVLFLSVLFCLLITGCSKAEQPEEEEDGLVEQWQGITNTEQPRFPPDREEVDYNNEVADIPDNEFRAVWVASVFNLDFPSSQSLTAADMKREIDAIVSRTAELGLNAIFFQVRPTGDAFYESSIFPWSHWLSGTQGQGIPDFDPLAYFIEASHAKDIELHAWLNPYRIIHTTTNSSDPNTLAPNNPIRLNPELAVAWTAPGGNQGLFLDPGLPEAKQLIIDGIVELVNNYNVDGIHIDDYFYPGRDFDDAASFERYGNGMDLDDWRRENVNTLIRDIQTTIREINEAQGRNVRWGISPSAIWMNTSSDPLGKPVTSTFESYLLLYADSRRWVLEGWVDYVIPQIYWYIGFESADFETILNWWIDICKDTDVDLYIGHAAWREDEDNQAPHWRGELLRQLEMVDDSYIVKGSVFYRFHSLRGALGNTIRDFYAAHEDDSPAREPVMICDTLSIGMPDRDVVFSASAANAPGYNIIGTSVPGIPLFMNGEEVTNRTIEGFFFVYAPLESGDNEFIFSQEGQEDVTRNITRNVPTGGGSGDAATVTVTQVTTPRYATVNTDDAWVFPSHTVFGGSDWMLQQGQVDRVVAESSNNFVRLSCGIWINRNAVTIRNETAFTENVLQNGVYRPGTNFDVIAWQTDDLPAVFAHYDGTALRVQFGMQTEVPPLNLPTDLTQTIFSNVSSGIDGDVPFFLFTIRDDVNFEGYFVEFEDDELRLVLKKRKSLALGDYPLTGITIVLDPGHGGEYYGALGPLGRDMPEKDIVLINAFKLTERLEALGATVRLTRYADVDVSLQERVNMSWRIKPDLFISLHNNSVAETTNAENIRGFTVWYRNPNAVDFSETVLELMYDIIPGTNRHRNINQANFFVCRPSWAPSVLFESGFIVNIDDFVYLIDPAEQARMADVSVEVILAYFGGE